MIFKPSSDTSCSRSCPVRGCYSCATAGLVVFTNRRRRRGGARGDFLFLRRLVSVAFPAPHAWLRLMDGPPAPDGHEVHAVRRALPPLHRFGAAAACLHRRGGRPGPKRKPTSWMWTSS